MGNNTTKSISKVRKQIFAYSLLQKILFEVIYLNIIFPPFEYYGFQANFSLMRYILSWLMYLLVPMYTAYCYRNETISRLTVAVLLNITYMPCVILFAYHDQTPFVLVLVLYYTTLALAAVNLKAFRFQTGIKLSRKNYEQFMYVVGIGLACVVLMIWAVYARFHLQLSFLDVYETRLTAREYSIPSILVYLRGMARSVTPLLAIYCAYKRKKILCTLFVFVQFIQFCIDGTKSVLFTMILGFAAYFFADRKLHIVNWVPRIMSMGAALAIIEYKIFNTDILSNFLFRRVMFVPALLNYQFYDLAQNNGLDYYRQSFGFLGESRYSDTIARVVGNLYYGNEAANANNGMFADAYVNLGVIGCIVMPIAIVFVFKMIEGAGIKLPKSVWMVCAIQTYLSFTSSSFFTVLITHGVLLMIMILHSMVPRLEDEENTN